MRTEEELLIILIEECGEVIQKATKIMRFGKAPPSESEKDLEDELGDVLCMIKLLEEYGTISKDGLDKSYARKREKLERWSNLPIKLLRGS